MNIKIIPLQSMAGAGGGEKIITHGGGSSNDNNTKKLYKGVRFRKWGKWVSEIRLPNSRERIWLGSHDSPEKAARAFDAALYCLRGHNATFNFPDTPFKLMEDIAFATATANQSLTPQEIQEIAAKFANQSSDPPPQQQQEEEQQHSSRFGSKTEENSNTCTTTSATSTSTVYEVQEDNRDMMMSTNNIDWTFLNVLDDTTSNNQGLGSSSDYNYNFGLYSDLEKMHSGEFLYTSPPPPLYDEDEIEADDPFSNQSFLWNWNF